MPSHVRSFAIIITVLPAIVFPARAQRQAYAQRPVIALEQFAYRDVTLTGGPLAAQAAAARAFYLAIPEDSLLQGFRLRAGLPAPGKPMGGWYDPEGFAGGHPFGQFISALSRMFAVTGDQRYRQKVWRLVHGFRETLRADGYFYSSQKVAREWPCYLYDKNCTGMRDAWTLTGCREALTVLSRMTDWAVPNLPRRSDEWYTLPENLYNCFALTGEKRYLKMAHEYDYSEGFYNLLANGSNAFTPEHHAYSHVNTLSSAAKTYEATGDRKYLTSVVNAWQFLTTTQMYASGGWGPDERFVTPGHGELAASTRTTGRDFETPCGSYANVNLDRYLLRFTGDTRYGDNMERVLYNSMLSVLPMGEGGRTFYYSDYRPGATKQYHPDAWPCCSGTYAEITADYPLNVYFHAGGDLYVNLFTPSRVRWGAGQHRVTVLQSTDFPTGETTSFRVTTSGGPVSFGLHLRVPAWVSAPVTVTVNGHSANVSPVPGTFFNLARTWHSGDTVKYTLPMSLHFEKIAPESPDYQAAMYGPLLLTALTSHPVSLTRQSDVRAEQTTSGRLPIFRSVDRSLTFLPFYQVTSQSYTSYLTVPTGGR